MKRTLTAAGVALAAIALSPGALADYDGHGRGGRYDFARVLDVQPIVHVVQVSTPHRECRLEDEVVYERRGYAGPGGDGTANMILGGIIGSVVGSQIGGGDGRLAATAAGAVLGAAVGNHYGRSRGRGGEYRVPRTVTREHCRTYEEVREERRVDGYRVTYRYLGETYTTRTDHDPGRRIRVRVDVTPAE